MKKFSLDFLKGTVDAIKGKANTLKNLFLKLDLTKKIIAISSLSAVVVAAIVIPLFVVNSGSGSNNENGSSTSDTPKAIALSFINACIDKDAEEEKLCFTAVEKTASAGRTKES